MEKKLKKLSLFLAIIIIFQFYGPLNFTRAEMDSEDQMDLEEILDPDSNLESDNQETLIDDEDLELTEDQEEGSKEEGEAEEGPSFHIKFKDGKKDILNIDELVSLEFSYSLGENHKHDSKELLEFKLPEELIFQDVSNIGLKSKEETEFAHYSLENGSIKISLLDDVSSLAPLEGSFTLEGEIQPNLKTEDSLKIDFNGSIMDLILRKQNKVSSITSLGQQNGSRIDWTIEVKDRLDTEVASSFKNILPSGLEYDPGSLKVNGSKINQKPIFKGQELKLDLSNLKGDLNISFSTSINYGKLANNSLQNKAYYYYGDSQVVEDEYELVIEDIPSMKNLKAIYNPEDHTITWSLDLNGNNTSHTDAKLVSSWEQDMDFIEDSLELIKLDSTKANSPKLSDSSYSIENITSRGFDLVFPNFNKDYRLSYKTKAPNLAADNNLIKNSLSWFNETREASVQLPSFSADFMHKSIDYDKKELGWTATINKDSMTLKDLEIIWPDQKFEVENLEILLDGETFKDYSFENNTIRIESEINKPLSLSYTKGFDYRDIKNSSFTERLSLNWEGRDQAYLLEAGFSPNKLTLTNGQKSGIYSPDSKEISWKSILNYQKDSLDNLTIKNNLYGGQTLIEESVKLFEADLDSNGQVTKGREIKDFDLVNGEDSFQVNLSKLNQALILDYKTSLAGLPIIDDSYKAVSHIYHSRTKTDSFEAELSIPYAGEYIGKSGRQNGKFIDWEIQLNTQQAHIEKARLTDEISNNQEFLKDSIEVYELLISDDGGLTKGPRLEDPELTISPEESDQVFTIEFGDIDRAYLVTYSTSFLASNREELTNSSEFWGSNIKNFENRKATKNLTVSLDTEAEKPWASLTIKKINEDEIPIPDVSFDLIDKESKRVIKSGITDKDGLLRFDNLIYGDYLLREKEAPEGYIKLKDDLEFTINEKTKSEAYKIINKKFKGELEIQVLDGNEKDVKIKDAEFELYDSKGQKIRELTLVTDANGQFTIPDLRPGKYYLKQTDAPDDYSLIKEKLQFEIKDDSSQTLKLKIYNVKNDRAFYLYKYDQSSKQALEGVEFTLFLKDEKGEFKEYGKYKTDYFGLIALGNLENGLYQLKETQALPGYIENARTYDFEIKNRIFRFNFKNFSIPNELDSPHQKVKKVDSITGEGLQDVEFELYRKTGDSEEFQGKYISNKDGYIDFKELPAGDYVFRETRPADGYIISDLDYDFTVGDDPLETIIVENTRKLSNLKLKKIDASNKQALRAAIFNFYRLNEGSKELLWKNLDTNDQGELDIENIPIGEYLLEEVQPPEGYLKLPTDIYLEITADSQDDILLEVPNAPENHGQIMKLETNSLRPIMGVVFRLEKKDQDSSKGWILIDDQIKTGSRGYALLPYLEHGQYRLTEIEAPEGLIMDPKPLEFTVDEDTQAQDLSFIIENSYKKPSIALIKSNEDDKPLSGARFKLFKESKEDRLIKNGEKDYFTTDSKGRIDLELDEAGNYYFVEIKAPKGYLLDDSPQRVKVLPGLKASISMTNKKLTESTKPNERPETEDGEDDDKDTNWYWPPSLSGPNWSDESKSDSQIVHKPKPDKGNSQTDKTPNVIDDFDSHLSDKDEFPLTIEDEDRDEKTGSKKPAPKTDSPKATDKKTSKPVDKRKISKLPKLPKTGSFNASIYLLLGFIFLFLGLRIYKK